MNRVNVAFTKLPKIVTIAKDVPKLAKTHKSIHAMATQRLSRIWPLMLSDLNNSAVRSAGVYSISSTHVYRNSNLRLYSTNVNNQKVVIASHKVLPMLEKSDSKDKVDKEEVFWKKVWDRCDPYVKLARMDKPIGTWLLFWPCSWSIALAGVHAGLPPGQCVSTLAFFLVGSFVMRGAGCTINDMWDRDIDNKVERTKERPLVSGALTQRQALAFLAAQLSLGLAVLLQLNWYSVALGASSMVLVVTYPLAKRFTNYPQLFLGATFNWGALLGWSALLGEINAAVCLPLYAGALCWSVVYDTIYAHQDKADDARIGMKSTALTFGASTRPLLAVFASGTLGGVALAGHAVSLEWPFYVALAGVAGHIGRQIYTLKPNDPSDCADKFRSNSLVGLIVFLGIAAGGWRRYRERRKAAECDGDDASEHSSDIIEAA